ncbi:ABC transporter substrate-binding protein [Gryllotalpicola sp.]|uniref:ABC transporter substrate-binding protein n=1 Tax=Gryllotalpicola sp. TaxID=1932787 RepID=UPI00262F1D41|nr:ABC transporter substrate-binding protein [Gryllotalpicola sp.]
MTGFPASAGHEFDRRAFLRLGGVGVLAVGGLAVLAACSPVSPGPSSTPAVPATPTPAVPATPTPGQYGSIAVQLSGIKTIEFAGEYLATTNGYYATEGFTSVDLIAGDDATTVEAALTSGSALVGLSTPALTAPAVAAGAPLKIIGSIYQKNPFCFLSLKEHTPIAKVSDLKGKVVGVPPGLRAVFQGFCTAKGLTSGERGSGRFDVYVVPADDDITPLEHGRYDAQLSSLTRGPVRATFDGYLPVVLGFAASGLPFTAATLTVTQDSIDTQRDLLKAFLIAEIKGWTDAINSLSKSADLAVNEFGKGLKLDLFEQTSEAAAQNRLILTDDVNENGLLAMTRELVDASVETLAAMGTTVAAGDLFDLSLLEELYLDHPELVVPFQLPS